MVLIPAGPDTVFEYLSDTIDSVYHHTGVQNCKVVVLDDSRRDKFASIGDRFPSTVVIKTPDYHEGTRSSTRGSLFGKQMYALKWLTERYSFEVLLRMDTDALMIGDSPHEDVLAFLERQPKVGMVGAFTRRGDGTDKRQAMISKGHEITREVRLRLGFRNLAMATTLRRLVKRAEANGYCRGDMCTGGAYFLSSSAVRAMKAQGFFDLDVLGHSKLMDDALMALLCCAAGYGLSDMPETDDILAINWRRVPMAPEMLVSKNKKIVHPIKDDDPTVEARVREYFQSRRGTRSGSIADGSRLPDEAARTMN
jgi:hypothetical protein